MIPFFFFFFSIDNVLWGFFSHMTSSEKRLKENGELDVFFSCLFCLFVFVDAITVV